MRSILAMLLFCLLTPASQGALYKWYDEQGNIHYSQFPPDKQGTAQDTFKIENPTKQLRLKPVLNRGRLYCGKLELPWYRHDHQLIVENISLGLKDWIKQRDALRDKLESPAGRTLSVKDRRQLQKKYAEQQCRADWAGEILDFKKSPQFKINYELKTLEEEYLRLKTERDSKCPNSADFYNKGWLVGKTAQDHMACQNKYNEKIVPIEKKIRRYRHQYKPYQAIK